jgi:hypothetical protein
MQEVLITQNIKQFILILLLAAKIVNKETGVEIGKQSAAFEFFEECVHAARITNKEANSTTNIFNLMKEEEVTTKIMNKAAIRLKGESYRPDYSNHPKQYYKSQSVTSTEKK